MSRAIPSLQHVVPANKFYPPHISLKQSVLRSSILDRFHTNGGKSKKIIAVEAQAGQGKTTLAFQLITHFKFPHIWYQIGKEDKDPVILLSGLLHSFSLNIDDFSSPQLQDILEKGEINTLDLPVCANILLHDIDKVLTSEMFIVFDDMHLLELSELTCNLLSYIMDTSPPRLRFILTSRQPLGLRSKVFRNRSNVFYVDTPALALSCNEIETLFNDVYHNHITRQEAKKLEDITNGWPMGIVLAAHPFSTGHDREARRPPFDFFQHASQRDMRFYFNEEIFTHIPTDLHTPFAKLSLLDDIHRELAEKLTGLDNIATILTRFTRENLFTYNLDNNFTIFRFHHLFQEFLQSIAKKILPKEEIDDIYIHAAKYFYERDMIAKVLSCYRQAGAYGMMDELLRQNGLDLLAQNKTVTLLDLLSQIPEHIMAQHGWLALFSAILESDIHPRFIVEKLERARNMFIERGDELGELISLAQTLYYHFVVSGRYNDGMPFLARCEELLSQLEDTLSLNVRIMVKRNLAAGFCFFSGDMKKARFHIDTARQLAMEHAIANFLASTIFIKSYIHIHCGEKRAFSQELELAHSLINDPLVSMANKFTLRVMLLNSLGMYGDPPNFFKQQKLVRGFIDEKVVKQTVAAPYFYVWKSVSLIALGKVTEALETAKKGLTLSTTACSGHMQSQLLQLKAFALALQGNAKRAITEIEKATTLREMAGGPFYAAFHYILAAIVYRYCNKKNKTKEFFKKGLQLAETIPSPYLMACGLVQRGLFKGIHYGEKSAFSDLSEGLKIMREYGYSYFWSWNPGILQALIIAVKNDIERDFCKALAFEKFKHAITDHGAAIPLLQITVLKDFTLSYGTTTISAAAFTPLQRELLGLLLIAKEKRINQEKTQLILWPDSPPKQSRQKLDTLLGRLRNSLSEQLPELPFDPIKLQKGVLSLQHSWCDLDTFQQKSDQGIHAFSRGNFWQAENYFLSALALWKGSLPSDFFRKDPIFAYEDQLLFTHEKIAIKLASIFEETGRYQDAISILVHLIDDQSLAEQGVLQLYKLYGKTHQPLKMKETIEKYKAALAANDYEREEIEEIILNMIDTE